MVRSLGAVVRAVELEHCEPRILLAAQSPIGVDAPVAELAGPDALQQIQDDWGLTGAGQTVAVIDSGIAYDHAALGGGLGSGYRVVGGWDFTEENDADPYDDAPAGFHGTHVAGVIGSEDAVHPGLAPEADLVALRVFNDQGRSDFRWIEHALQWVHDNRLRFEHPITTVNLSIGVLPHGSPSEWFILEDEFAQLIEDGVFVTVAAGNKFAELQTRGLSYPASSEHVVAVGSVDADGQLSDFSQRVPGMLVANGEDITSTATDFISDFNGITDDFYSASGTSMAAPYVAGAAVIVREALEQAGYTDIGQQQIVDLLSQTADVVHDRLTGHAYRHVNLMRAVESIGTKPELPRNLVSLGNVAYVELSNQPLDSHYQLQATNQGYLTIEVDADWTAHDVELRVLDENHRVVAVQRGSDLLRLDVNALANQAFIVELSGSTGTAELTIANLVAREGDLATVYPAATLTQIAVRRNQSVTLNELTYDFVSGVSSVHVDAAPASQVVISGGNGPDEVWVRQDAVALSGEGFQVEVRSAGRVQINGGPGQGDTARFYGTSGDDVFVSHDAESRMTGTAYSHAVSGFESVYAFSGGGLDRAFLHGSAADEIFVAGYDDARLSTDSHLAFVEDFDRVYAYAQPGGLDRAFLHGSAYADHFAAYPDHAVLSSKQQIRYAESFDRVYAEAQPRGVDRAQFHGSTADDRFISSPDSANMEGEAYFNSALRFDRVLAHAGEGNDVARLYDSPGYDTFEAGPGYARIEGTEYFTQAFEFEAVDALATSGGFDRAVLWGHAGQDDLLLEKEWTTISSDSYRHRIHAFDQIHAIGQGSYDRTIIAAALAGIRLDRGMEFEFGGYSISTEEFESLENPSAVELLFPGSGFDRLINDI